MKYLKCLFLAGIIMFLPVAGPDASRPLQRKHVLACRELAWGKSHFTCRFHADGGYWMALRGQRRIRGVWWIDRRGYLDAP